MQLRVAVTDDVNRGIHDPATGAKNVEALVANPAVMAIIGPLYDSLAKSEIPPANRVHLAIVSPAVTNECLTQEPPDGHCHGLAARLQPRGSPTFFRVVTTQPVEAAASADLAFRPLGKRSAFIVNDQTAVGLSLASAFSDRFTQDGGRVVDPSDLGAFDPSQAPDFGPRVDRARELGADVIYFAGTEIGAAAALRRAMLARGLPVPLLGPDSLANGQFARLAGDAAHGSYYTVVGPHPATIRAAATFLRDYQRAYAQDAGASSLAAFDATTIVIRAIARAIDDAGGKMPTRDQVLLEISHTSEDSGAMGIMGFDARGDTTLKLISVFQWLASTQPAGDFVAQLTIH